MTNSKLDNTLIKESPDIRAHSAREKILLAARTVFAEKGLEGARAREISRLAGTNAQLIYYYYGSKDYLYKAVMERIHFDLSEEEDKLDLDGMHPVAAIRALTEFTFDYLRNHNYHVRLVVDENIHKARHISNSDEIKRIGQKLIRIVKKILDRGVKEKVFRDNVDSLQTYITITGSCIVAFSHIHTSSVLFDKDFSAPNMLRDRRREVVETALRYLSPAVLRD